MKRRQVTEDMSLCSGGSSVCDRWEYGETSSSRNRILLGFVEKMVVDQRTAVKLKRAKRRKEDVVGFTSKTTYTYHKV